MNKKCEGCPQNTACVRNVLRRSASEIIAWCKEKKKELHLTNHAISIGTNVPKGMIDRVFTEKSDILDVRMATLLPIVWYLAEKLGIADCNPQEQADPKEVARLTELAEDLRTTINRQNVDAKNARQDHRDEVATLIQMNRIKTKALIIVSTILFIALAIIITTLIVDRLNHDIGFFWLSGR